nr:hypothetical protein BaRGS_029471 [Batillaria attramentaria]
MALQKNDRDDSRDTLRARHFFMNSHSKGCPDVVGWLAIKDRPDPCPWGQKSAYPAFIFSSTASKINYNIPGAAQADVMTIAVNRRPKC